MRPSIPAGLVLGIPALVLLVFLSLPLLALLGRAVLGGLLADVAVRSDVLVALGLSLVTTAVSIVVSEATKCRFMPSSMVTTVPSSRRSARLPPPSVS